MTFRASPNSSQHLTCLSPPTFCLGLKTHIPICGLTWVLGVLNSGSQACLEDSLLKSPLSPSNFLDGPYNSVLHRIVYVLYVYLWSLSKTNNRVTFSHLTISQPLALGGLPHDFLKLQYILSLYQHIYEKWSFDFLKLYSLKPNSNLPQELNMHRSSTFKINSKYLIYLSNSEKFVNWIKEKIKEICQTCLSSKKNL